MRNPVADERVISVVYQLTRWLHGESIHNGVDRQHGECCPDFSCCVPSLLEPVEKRFAYVTKWLKANPNPE